ncbi:manganese catalase family protein [Bacillus sp. T33-2]|uniref:manganese catalase family protein n=1 Tax=Bacillus sp. T33-2 TaxID=2054168 RepID=UPI000C770F68|nr:manganese catalase family protein [Bacillus sp. T33-2]PLR96747.1 manganese catalase [Bacillus sp. T33-2]
MFYHVKELQYHAKPERPDPLFARKLQEILGGQFGEMTVAMQYLFQGLNTREHGKYRDLLMDTATEEFAHIEMLATMIARLLENAPIGDQEVAAQDPVVGAILSGMNPQHVIVSGLGALPSDSNGYRWRADFIISSGNLLADFRSNLEKESHGRLQTVRLFEETTDPGVKDMLQFLISRDTMHQNQWYAAICELESKSNIVVPSTFPPQCDKPEFSHTFFNLSRGEQSAAGRWAHGPSMDSTGYFRYVANPRPYGDPPVLPPAPCYAHDTPPDALRNPEPNVEPHIEPHLG